MKAYWKENSFYIPLLSLFSVSVLGNKIWWFTALSVQKIPIIVSINEHFDDFLVMRKK